MTRTLRQCIVAGTAVAVVGLALVAPAAATSAPTQLVLPQSAAFGVLGHSCGGIQEQTFATQFDPGSGFPMGDVYLKTSCAGSGKGGPTTTYTAWASATWDFTGALVASGVLASAPSVDPAFTATDANGNELYNASTKAYLALGPSFVPAPRVTAISVAAGPAAGGTSVTIDGTGFGAATAVNFGPTPAASFTINGPDSITAVSAPASAGTIDVTVSSAGGPSTTSAIDQFTLVAAPVVAAVSPNHGPVGGGTLLTITGSHLGAVTAVFMGDQQVGFTPVSDAEITLVTPVGENPDSLQVYVVSIGGTSATSAATQFTYLAPGPTFRANPAAIAPGAAIKFSGTGFRPAETIKVTYKTGLRAPHPSSVVLCTATASATGSFWCKGVVHAATAGAKGLHTVTARGSTSRIAVTLKVKLT
jgi:IPT/TIG domain